MVKVELSDAKAKEVAESLLTNAFEGGSNYWYRIDGYVWPVGKTRKMLEAEKAATHTDSVDKMFFPHIDTALMGGSVKVRDMEGDKGVVLLDWSLCERGLRLLLEGKGGQHHAANVVYDFLGEEGCAGCKTDAETGDVFLQLALWGEVIYG